MDHLPIFVELEGRPCLVVGGGAVAERKVRELLEAGAVVTIVSPTVTAGLEQLVDASTIQLQPETFQENQLGEYWLVVAATADRELNSRIARAAESQQRFCNVVDDAELCSFIMPAVVKRAPITVAVSLVMPPPGPRVRRESPRFLARTDTRRRSSHGFA